MLVNSNHLGRGGFFLSVSVGHFSAAGVRDLGAGFLQSIGNRADDYRQALSTIV